MEAGLEGILKPRLGDKVFSGIRLAGRYDKPLPYS